MATEAFVIGDLPTLAAPLDGSELIEFQVGTGAGSSQHGTAADVRTFARRQPVTALTIAAGVVNIDLSLGDLFTLTLTANVTSLTFSNVPATGYGKVFAVRIAQDATGGRTLALPAGFKATGGSDTAVGSAASALTLLTAMTFDQGTRWEYVMKGCAA